MIDRAPFQRPGTWDPLDGGAALQPSVESAHGDPRCAEKTFDLASLKLSLKGCCSERGLCGYTAASLAAVGIPVPRSCVAAAELGYGSDVACDLPTDGGGGTALADAGAFEGGSAAAASSP